jgi:hypothetical protein
MARELRDNKYTFPIRVSANDMRKTKLTGLGRIFAAIGSADTGIPKQYLFLNAAWTHIA